MPTFFLRKTGFKARFKQKSDEKIGEFNRSREVRGGRRRK